ncbi:MAG: hypothetical protein ACLQQB_10470 [Solirubrobacteraceae bacterium]|jgi:hypothetical protein
MAELTDENTEMTQATPIGHLAPHATPVRTPTRFAEHGRSAPARPGPSLRREDAAHTHHLTHRSHRPPTEREQLPSGRRSTLVV